MADARTVTVLLVWSILIPLTISQLGPSQAVTTVTSVQYSVTSLATFGYSTSWTTATATQPVSYERTPYDYSYQSDTFSFWQTEFTSRPTSGDYPCLFYDYFLLNATKGQELQGQFELLVPGRTIYFFILNQNQFRRFNSHNCAYGWDGSSELRTFASAYDLDWVVPTSGEYALLFLSTAFYGGRIQFLLQEYSTTVLSQTIAYTTSSTLTLQSNQTVVSTLQSMNSQSSSAGYLTALIGVVIIGLSVGILVIKHKRS